MNSSFSRTKKTNPLFLNPLLKKLADIKGSDSSVSTYGGIFGKFIYFLLMIVAGIGVSILFSKIGGITVDQAADYVGAEKYVIICILVAVGIFIIFPFLAFLLRKLTPLFGSLYCVGLGFLLGCMMMLDTTIGGYMLLALAMTLAIVICMAILYFKGIIRITNKFRALAMTSLSTFVFGSVLMLVASFVPMLKPCVDALRGNLFLSIGASLIGIAIATMILLVDFETVRETVEGRLPKQYEWFAAFSVTFTVVWLYLKVLDLVFKIKDANA